MTDNSASSRIHGLLKQAQAGDVAARNELLESCRNYINLLARTHVETWMNGKVDASDLVQQTLLEAYAGFSSFEGKSEAEWLAWIKQILAHNTQDFIRQFRTAKRDAKKEVRRHGQAANRSSPLMDLPAELQSPSQVMIQSEQELELANAISQLPEDYQDVIQLRNLQRLPFEDVAERMGRSRGAVQMLWARALKRLQEILGEHPDSVRIKSTEE